jgi:hypothetical protein
MLRAQPLSFFEKLRSSVGVHYPHVNWSTIWAFPGLFNVLLLWKSLPSCLWSKLAKIGDRYTILGRWQNRLGYFSPIS